MPEVHIAPPMAVPVTQYSDQRQHCTIASIWPRPLRSEEPHCRRTVNSDTGEVHNFGCTVYEVGPGSLTIRDAAEQVQLLTVYDSWQVRQLPAPAGQNNPIQPLPLHCRTIADALVKKWTGEPGGAQRPKSMGIMVIAGDKPTTAELQRMIASQNAYFQDRFDAAQMAWQQGNLRLIGAIERAAARWMNAHSKVEWYSMTNLQDMKECVSCGGSLPGTAIACPQPGCGDLLAKAIAGYWSETELKEKDEFLYKKMKDMQRREYDRNRKKAAAGDGSEE